MSGDHVRLLVVPLPTWRPSLGEALRQELNQRFGPGLSFEVVPVDDIPLAPTGKFQTIVPLAQPTTPTS